MADVFDLYGNLSLAVNLEHTRTGDDTCVTSDPLIKTIVTAFTNGTGNGQADKVFHERRTLAAEAYKTYAFASHMTPVRLNETISFATVKAIIIHSTLAANKELTLGGIVGAAFVEWVGDASDLVKIQPGGLFVLTAPNTGYATTGADELLITNAAGGSSTYDIIVIGTSA